MALAGVASRLLSWKLSGRGGVAGPVLVSAPVVVQSVSSSCRSREHSSLGDAAAIPVLDERTG